ncbi:MAG TPA: ABC transporter permease [Spirochaetia bacterium]|nr:ABC transporter permease [Spirochaetales bacterium]HRW24733.1 ABC transporter permease [Spirochaetia bacterium]
MRKLPAIIRYEFKLMAANKAFVILTILGPFLILAITVLPGLLSMNPKALSGGEPIAIAASSGAGAQGEAAALYAAFESAMSSQGRGVEPLPLDDEAIADAKRRVGSGKLAALVVMPAGWADSGATLYTKTGTDAMLYGTVERVVDAFARESRIARSGVDPDLARSLVRSVDLSIVKLSAGDREEAGGEGAFVQTLFTAMSFVMLVYMTTLLYGQMIGRSVVTEKTSKTVEIMLSSVSPRELMFGKILGLGLAGLLQYGVWVSLALVLSKLLMPLLGMAAPSAIAPGNLAWLVVFFVLAFFLYASLYAALGAAAEDEQHLGQLAWPVLVFLIVPLVMISSFVSNPDSPLSVGLSLFPMTSPIVMLIRVLIATPPAWQLTTCIGVLVVSVYGAAAAAAKIFRVGILMGGKRASFGEMVKWLRVR